MAGVYMASPYVAGISALALENGKSDVHKYTASAIANTVRPQIHPSDRYYYSIVRQGTVIVDEHVAVTAQVLLNVSLVSGRRSDSNWRDGDIFINYLNDIAYMAIY
ncbi:hypothetical protein BJ085DRAFT_30456 [Dimargaris cristalligena]|uniref:Peptidase S8/S53 domain-containing protein n=1 Tax=Dimargaris cristalligena TaxID=215637 RepID=A0A4Q0A0Y7_9FUNG|nr:hypothetical protein BJ085DRAFT_30456 [Dimargaris cristalligena]|eukprot:RKP38790.1 hypothetical protein BJ085DRAFT_30456 [Dimargaris cristalligena]